MAFQTQGQGPVWRQTYSEDMMHLIPWKDKEESGPQQFKTHQFSSWFFHFLAAWLRGIDPVSLNRDLIYKME